MVVLLRMRCILVARIAQDVSVCLHACGTACTSRQCECIACIACIVCSAQLHAESRAATLVLILLLFLMLPLLLLLLHVPWLAEDGLRCGQVLLRHDGCCCCAGCKNNLVFFARYPVHSCAVVGASAGVNNDADVR